MIVKNESAVITRCLESVLPLIDYWVICDTGSTDGTQDIIKNYMKEKKVPGELHERPWKNFGHNRNEALQLAKGKADYVMFIDADEYLTYDDDFVKPELDKDYYYFILTWPGSEWKKISLINNHQDWKWEGVLHEVICPPASRSVGTIDTLRNHYTVDGARSSDPKKYEKDAAVLEEALKEDPNNSRHIFYLAKSYENAGNREKALENYKRRADMALYHDSEAFISMVQIARLQEEMKMAPEIVIESYKRACTYMRLRAEPYYHLARYYRSIGDNERCFLVASIGQTIPIPDDLLWVETWMYDYGLLMEISVSSYWCEKYKECQEASLAMLKVKDLPDNYKDCALQNLGFANAKLLEKVCQR
ncbi:MAG: glycosyltransferase [Verrucomicrobia bacterium]|nr:glycosyltransferase [Verrucomicrobiota bacterium]MBS0636671.1 glycosyltransferase [Verrucomicrobiota bacterium]